MDLDTTDWTPLIWASYNGDVSAVASLLKSRVDHLFYDSSSKTALHWAILGGYPDVVRMLLKRHTEWLANERTEPSVIDLSYEQMRRSTLSIPPIELAAEINDSRIFNILVGSLPVEYAPAQFNGVWSPSNDDVDSVNRLSSSRISQDIEAVPESELATLTYVRRWLLQIAVGGDKYAIVDKLLTQASEDPEAFFGVSTALHMALHVAAMSRGGCRYVYLLVKHGADPNHVHYHEGTALGRAIVFGDEDTITALLECGASPHAIYLNMTPLALACEVVVKEDPHLSLRLIRQLLAKGASVHTSNVCSPLHSAARFSTLEVIKELVSLGADVTSTFRGQSILEALAEEDGYKADDDFAFKEALEFLMGHFPPDHVFDSESILARTLRPQCNPALFLTFINAGFSFSRFDEGDFHGRLLDALEERSVPTILLLLESIRDRNDWEDILTYSPIGKLLSPCRKADSESPKEHFDFAFYFLSRFVETGVVEDTMYGLSPLVTDYNGVDAEVLAQAIMDCGDCQYYIPFEHYDSVALAAIHGKPKLLAALLHGRPDPECLDHWLDWFDSVRPTVPDDATAVFCCLKMATWLDHHGESYPAGTPIFTATARGDADTVSKLILAGADIENKTKHGWRPLHLALFLNHESIAHILLDAGADANAATTHWGDYRIDAPTHRLGTRWVGRPLHFAAMRGYISIAQKLITLGADVNASSFPPRGGGVDYFLGHRTTPLHFALDNVEHRFDGGPALTEAHLSVAQLLIDYGADITGAVSNFKPNDILKFAKFQGLWDTLRAGVAKDEV